MREIELLAPAGDLEKLKIAVDYGADAVYFGGEHFGLRAGSGNFSLEEMQEGIAYARKRGKKCYMTLNVFPHNEDIKPIENYLKELAKQELVPDAFLVSDPGMLEMVKEFLPEAELHLSTQANMTNYRTANFWHAMGVSRVVLARELSLAEVREIRDHIPEEMEIEAFVHGAMCISYSGRCLLSNFMVQRDANRGACAHPCRWKYSLVEEQRPGEYYPIEEDERGTYIMNSKDLCMIEHLPELIEAGVESLKIEGRMKSIFYVANVVQAYRKAIDAYKKDPTHYEFQPEWIDELRRASHREFTTAFFFDKADDKSQNYKSSAYEREYTFLGVVKEYDADGKRMLVQQRNKMVEGDLLEIFGPGEDVFVQELQGMTTEDGEAITAAPHPKQMVWIPVKQPVSANGMLCKRKENNA